MQHFAVQCGCGRSMTLYGRAGRNAFRCGCGARVQVLATPVTTRLCTFGDCRMLATTKEPLRFCPEHQEPAASLLAHTAGAAKVRELEDGLGLSPSTWTRRYGYAVTPVPTNQHHAPLVYFARRDRLIKIGWTSQLHKRMKAMQTTALATEPGDVVLERQLHRRFAHLLAQGREWFHPKPELIAYINDLRRASGASGIAAEDPLLHVSVELTAYLAETVENPITRTITQDGQPLAGRMRMVKLARSPERPRVHAAVTGAWLAFGSPVVVAACSGTKRIGSGTGGLVPASRVPHGDLCSRSPCRTRWEMPDACLGSH